MDQEMLGPERPRPDTRTDAVAAGYWLLFCSDAGRVRDATHEVGLPRFLNEAEPPAHCVDRAAI